MSKMVKVIYEEKNSRLYRERDQSLQKDMEKKETSLQKGMQGMVENHCLHLHHPHTHLHPHLLLILPFHKNKHLQIL